MYADCNRMPNFPVHSRRTFLQASLAASVGWPLLGAAHPQLELPLPNQLDGASIVRRAGLAGTARVERLGASRGGRPIDLISIGSGDRNALIVGAPHANEPIGCLTIVRMLERFAFDRTLHDSGWQWHFIPAIDMDGITLNQGWFRGPRTLHHYLDNFYRPPFRLQPEYSFPLEVPGYRFTAETPESTCWRQALEHVRPQLQCSLHGADTGGSFFILSEDRPALAAELVTLPAAHRITLNRLGETFADLHEFRPGAFSFPKLEDKIARAVAAGTPPDSVWNAGDSSAGFAAKRFHTLSMTCEVPLWRDPREEDTRDSGLTLVDVISQEQAMLREDEKLLRGLLPTLRTRLTTFDEQSLAASLGDFVASADEWVQEIEEAKSDPIARKTLRNCDLVQYEFGAASLRNLAMARRLLPASSTDSTATAVRSLFASRLAAYSRAAKLLPVPLEQSTGLQRSAILAATRSIHTAQSS